MGGERGTRREVVNNIFAYPVTGILMVFPFEISVLPEVIDEVVGTLEGLGRFPSADKSRQLSVTKQCTNN